MSKDFQPSEDLYGISLFQLKKLAKEPYEYVIKRKIELAKDLIKFLNKTHYTKRDTHRINRIVKAIKFNEQLLKELK